MGFNMEQLIQILPGEVVLFMRGRSKKWQCRYKLADKKWRRTSTGESDSVAAGKAALRIYYEGEVKRANKLPIDTKRFSSVADAVVKAMQVELDEGTGKAVYHSYIFAINGYLKPFFGKHGIDSITPALLKKLDDWRVQKMGRVPKASTITNHNSALNKVFDYAEQYGWVTPAVRPTLVNKGKKGEARPAFTLQEYKTLCGKLPHWVKKGRGEKSLMMRELLRDYIFILVATGIRHGTEAQNLKWRHIDWHKKGDERYLRLTVTGKTGTHSAIARHNAVNYFERIQSRFPALAGMTFDKLIAAKVDEYVFRLADGTQTNSLNQTFEVLMKDTGLAVGAASEKQRTLYSLRHTYATLQLLEGRSIHELAKQMGTSVAMLEQHYSKITPELVAEKFAGPKRKSHAKTVAKVDEAE
jgi:integrase